jgi:hypothetical protein
MNQYASRLLVAGLLLLTVVACGGADQGGATETGDGTGKTQAGDGAYPAPGLPRPAPTPTHASGLATPPAIAIPTSALPVTPALQPTLPAMEAQTLAAVPFKVPVPAGWALRETGEGLIVVQDTASLASAELECPALLIRRVPGVGSLGDVLEAYDLSGALRQKEIPLVVAGSPVDAIDATLSSPTTGRVYQVVLAPMLVEGDGWLVIASMPEGQAGWAWPTLATMLGSITLAGN